MVTPGACILRKMTVHMISVNMLEMGRKLRNYGDAALNPEFVLSQLKRDTGSHYVIPAPRGPAGFADRPAGRAPAPATRNTAARSRILA